MSLSSKIEEIRQKPEREKIRYVWGMVFICMVFIIFVWIFSLKSAMKREDVVNSGSEVTDSFESLENKENMEGTINNDATTEINQGAPSGFGGE